MFRPQPGGTYVRMWNRKGNEPTGQGVVGRPARPGAQHRANRQTVRSGPVDGFVLDEEARVDLALPGEARGPGRHRPCAARGARGGGDDHRGNRSGGTTEQRDRASLVAAVRAAHTERGRHEAATRVERCTRRRPAEGHDVVPSAQGNRVHDRGARVLPVQALPRGIRGPSPAKDEGDPLRGSRGGGSSSVAMRATFKPFSSTTSIHPRSGSGSVVKASPIRLRGSAQRPRSAFFYARTVTWRSRLGPWLFPLQFASSLPMLAPSLRLRARYTEIWGSSMAEQTAVNR
jgi:hypothetical protein